MIAKPTLCTLLLALAAASCYADKEDRSANMTDAVTHVIQTDMRARFGVEISYGKKPALEVEAPADVLDFVRTNVDGERLTITSIPGAANSTGKVEVKVRVVLTNLTQVDVMGPGETSIRGFDLDALSIDAAGGGKTTMDSKVKTLKIRMAGAGDALLKAPADFEADTLEGDVVGTGSLDASAFKAQRVNLNLAGTSDASVFATKAITVRGAGTGDLTVRGNPQERSIGLIGTGKVRYVDRRLRA